MDIQSWSFFDLARSPMVVRSRTYVVGRRILLPLTAKACLASIETTVGASRYPAREKAVTVFPRDLFPTDA